LNTFAALKKRIKTNEGFSAKPYKDCLGFLTIGYGHLIKTNEKQYLKEKLSKQSLKKIFDEDFKKALHDFEKNYKQNNYPKNIKDVLIEMIFQLGINNQKKFIKMNGYICKKQLFLAALEMKDSLWYKQTPSRVDKLINILLHKEYEKK